MRPLPPTTEQEPNDINITQYRGRALLPKEQSFLYIEDALIQCSNGKILSIAPAGNSKIPITHYGGVWIPGLVDSHLHYPQTRITGSASGPLIPWLNSSVFPEEARFSEPKYARSVAIEFCNRLIKAGTTTAFIYSSPHPQATHILFEELENHGIRGYAGMTLMNRNAPDENLLSTSEAYKESIDLIHTWNHRDHGRLQYVITPRFCISCTPELLEMASGLCTDHDLWMQTHLSENRDEIEFTLSLFPDSSSYTDIYHQFGLIHQKSIYAHCIHLEENELKCLAEQQAIIAHCPDSNFFLGSGGMPIQKILRHNISIMLGSDIGAGRSFSIAMTAGRAYDNSLLQNHMLSPETLLYLACVAPRKRLSIMDEADFSVVSVPPGASKKSVIDAILFRHDQCTAIATYVRGQQLRIS